MPYDVTFYCEPGSPSFRFTPPDVWGRGVGGAELSLISLAATLAARGHAVTIYNDASQDGSWQGVQYRHARHFDPRAPQDVFVVYRNPSRHLPVVKARQKVFFTTDQMTTHDYELAIYPYVDIAIGISEFHKRDHLTRYGIRPDRFTAIDLGVRLSDYEAVCPKTPNRLLHCSVPHRGAIYLPRIFRRIRQAVPTAELVITGDYSLWGPTIPNAWHSAAHGLDALFDGLPGVTLLGAVSRQTLIDYQMTADLLVYPHYPVNGLPELFGVSVAECLAAGAVPVITNTGALPGTVGNHGVIVFGDARAESVQDEMADRAIELLQDRPRLALMQERARQYARQRFDWQRIAAEWERVLA